MAGAYCSDCKRNRKVVFDHSAGDTVCSECGLVLESHSIDETSEWRTFPNESGDNDLVRVGDPTNPLLNPRRALLSVSNSTLSPFNGSISTTISSRGAAAGTTTTSVRAGILRRKKDSDNGIFANMELGIEKLVENPGMKNELKMKSLRNSIGFLTMVASLNSKSLKNGSTSGTPNSHLSACA